MYTDTHFHFHMIADEAGNKEAAEILCRMKENNTYFAMDIGTECSDLCRRANQFEEIINTIEDTQTQNDIKSFLYFSAGIWPSKEAIINRFEQIKILQKEIETFRKTSVFKDKLCALGEGGIDRHWNTNGTDERNENDFTKSICEQEEELFYLQLELAKEMKLPYIVHSRDGFEATYNVIKESDNSNGVLHCFSYGIEEAKKILDLNWYISISGAITYTKKSKLEDTKKLLKYIPADRLLLETDSPYLSPVPLRGQMNTPLNVKHTYEFVSQMRECSLEELNLLVDENCKKLFLGLNDCHAEFISASV